MLGAKVTSSVLWLGGAQIARRASGLLISTVLARLLLPRDFGLVALATASLGVLTILSESGFGSALVQRKEVAEDHLTTVFTSNLVVASGLALIGWMLSPMIGHLYGSDAAVPLLRAMLVTLPLSGIAQVPDALLQRRLAFRAIGAVDWSSAVTAGVVGIALAYAGAGPWALVGQAVTLVLISASAKMYLARWRPRIGFVRDRAGELAAFGLSVLGSALATYFCNNIDNVIVGARLGPEALGYYALAFNLAMLPFMSVSALVARVMFPALASVRDDRTRYVTAYVRLLRTISTVALPAVVGLAVIAPVFIPTVYGSKWLPTVPVLQALLVVGAVRSVNTAGTVLYSLGRASTWFKWMAGSAVLMCICFLAGTRWGLLGVAGAYILVEPVVFAGPQWVVNRTLGLAHVKFLAAIAPGFAASAVMGVAVVELLRAIEDRPFSPIAVVTIATSFGALIYVAALLFIALLFGRARATPLSWLKGQHLVGAT